MGKLAEVMAKRQAMLSAVGEALVSSTQQRFQDGQDKDAIPWEPSQRAQSEGGKTLENKGLLRDSIDYMTTPDSVMVGSNVAYARIHQMGGTITPKKGKYLKFKGKGGKDVFVKKVTIPARPYLGVSEEDKEEVQALIADFMRGKN